MQNMTAELQKTEPPKRQASYDLGTFRVLIVEDYPFIADLLHSSLNELGVGSVLVSPNIAAAKEKILNFNLVASSTNLDVIVLDWLMPDGKGFELLHWIRNHESDSIKYLAVIVCSAYTNLELVTQSRDSGANEVLVKPVSAEKLARRILSVIDKPRPFLKTGEFFGPDRRRKKQAFAGADRRKTKPEEVTEKHEQLQ